MDWKGVVLATIENRATGIGLVTCSFNSAVPFGIIEDIVIESAARGLPLRKMLSARYGSYRRMLVTKGIRRQRLELAI